MKFTLTTLLLLSGMLASAQNLLPNPGFDEVNICIEYFAKCAPRAWFPTAPFFSKVIYDGDALQANHMVTLTMESKVNTTFRPYYKTQLLNKLIKGTRYKMEVFMLDAPESAGFLDVKLDTAETVQDLPVALQTTPTLHLTKKTTGKPTNNWIKLEQEFTAADHYGYLVMGNMTTLPAKIARNLLCYIDSIALTPIDGQTYDLAGADSIRALLYNDRWRHSYARPSTSLYSNALSAKIKLPTRVSQRSGRCDTILLAPEFFSGNKKDISRVYADQLGETFKLKPEEVQQKILINGYSYLKPSQKYNEIIATDRANEVAKYLVYRRGFSFDDFIIKGNTSPRPGMDSLETVEIISCQPAPLPPAIPVTRTDTLIIPDILFAFDSSSLNKKMLGTLDSLVAKIPDETGIQLAVTGHTDNKGTALYNQDLSMRRANTIAAYVKQRKQRIAFAVINGMGESMPVAENNTTEGRQKNRRVEIIIFYPPAK
ncbi:OmpA family protein [Chitinophaga sp. sic0106]|uniref:OmpA family protein n=1 Tax=Chitinophaga sp. sic0106 TaxID=2854785 RepID=UPI001C43C83E|nr:OmpA family protein [Chitinophaga sp. sic0106]MBV7533220.1 OmpA family protein [Chitinophaga sp. sic0106]